MYEHVFVSYVDEQQIDQITKTYTGCLQWEQGVSGGKWTNGAVVP